MKRYIALTLAFILILSSSSCLALSEVQKKDYGLLESAVSFSTDKVIGEYGRKIPDDFSGDKLMQIVKDKIPEDYYRTLKKYTIRAVPKGTYYLLMVFNPENDTMILFDYSCTPEIDGPILINPKQYQVDKLDQYDKCKGQ